MIVWLNMFLYEVGRACHAFVDHKWRRYAEERMHAVTTLEQRGERRVREVILHLQQVDKLWHPATLFHDLLKVEVRIGDEFVNGFLVRENAILVRLLMLKDA